MKLEQFKLGDVVQLKSSSTPQMTVIGISGSSVDCCWSEGNKLKRQKFPDAALLKTENTAESRFRAVIDQAQVLAKDRLDSKSKS